MAERLAAKGWKISIADMDVEGRAVVSKDLKGMFHQTDVRDYTALAKAFDSTFISHGRIDFVFANAGINDPNCFYTSHSQTPPPPPDLAVIDINLTAVINTSFLAQHYFRLSKLKVESEYDPCLVMTSSQGGLISVPFIPLYVAAKWGVVGLMRSLAPQMYMDDGIRVSCICPGMVKTKLALRHTVAVGTEDKIEWTPIEQVWEAVETLMSTDGGFGKCLKIDHTGTIDVEGPTLVI